MDIKNGIDEAVRAEIDKQSPGGYLTKPYSRQIWNEFWKRWIFHLRDLGQTPRQKAYRGPSGPEFIRYIHESRRLNGLPELE